MQEEYIKQKQGKMISEKALEEKKENIGREMNELDKRMSEFNAEIEKKRDGLLDDFGQKMTAVIKNIAKKEKISMVLSKSISIQASGTALVIYADEDLDLTDAVIADMDKNEKIK
jgi:Skp family chaperone for outer membrane proteins